MTARSYFPSRTLAALVVAACLGGGTSVQAVTTSAESAQPVMIYKQLGFAFGFTNSTPSNLLGGFGGGGGGFGGGGGLPPVNVGPAGGNFLMAPAGGGGGVTLVVPPVVQRGGAPIVGGESQPPTIGQTSFTPVPDAGVSSLGFALLLAGMATLARRFARAGQSN